MAFNPFEAFSIRSKLGRSVMAVLGIVVMLTFVLSTGAVGSKNDFFDQIGGLFGGKGRGEVVATGYDEDIRDTDLSEVKKQRQAAIGYLQESLDASYTALARSVENDLKSSRISQETKRDIERFISLKVSAANDEKNRAAYAAYVRQFRDFQQFSNPEVRQLAQAMSRARLKPDSEDKKALDAVAAIILHDLGETPFVPVGELGENDKDIVNYILLQKKADQLGIKYSRDGVLDLVRRETGGRLTDEDSTKIYQRMRSSSRSGEFSLDWLMTAVGNEFRARAALAAIEGQSPAAVSIRQQRGQSLPALILGIDANSMAVPGAQATTSALPGGMTPYEFWEFFKDRCSEHTFSLFEIPVEAFIDQVTAKPTEKELKDFFSKYRADLPDPSKDRPGFKEPRKVKVQYVTLDATAKRITDAIPKLEAANVFLAYSAASLSGNPAAALTTASHPAMAQSLPLKQMISEKMGPNLSEYQFIEQFRFSPRDYSIYRPEPIVALLGGLSGYPNLTGSVGPLSLMIRQIEAHDLKTRVPFLLQQWLTPFNPTMGNALGMPAFALALNPKLPAEGVYLPDAIKELKKRQRQELFQADVRELEKKLRELTKDASPFMGPKPEKAKVDKAYGEASKYLETWLKDRGLTAAGTKTAIDQFAIKDDPDLKKLNELAIPEPDGTNSLSKKLFDTIDPRFPIPNMQPFQPEWFPAEGAGDGLDKPNYLMWVVEEVEAKHYNTLINADAQTGGAMSKRVEKAWKMEKARTLAQAEADRLAEQVRGITKTAATDPLGVYRQLLDLAAQKKYRQFELEQLAVLKFEKSPTQARQTYEKPKLEKSKVLYPTDKFVDQLLDLRKQPVGAVTVLSDSPRSRFYVAAEIERSEKRVDQFREVFARSTGSGVAQDPLYLQFALPEERGKAIDDVFARLRAEAKYDEKEAFKKREKKDQERKRRASRH